MSRTDSAPPTDTAQLAELGQQLRVDAVRAADAAGSGHPTSSMSAADLAAVLLSRYLCYDFGHPEHPGNDHFILSKGHASPLLYAVYLAAGAIDDEELLTFRKKGSRLEGRPTPAHSLGGRGDRVAGAGPADRCGHGAGGQTTRPGPLSRMGVER